ncbi:hypothetical protein [Caballeronia sp. M23-90]
MNMNLSGVKDQLAAMLKDRPPGTTADITEHTVIYWDGRQAVGAHVIADRPGFEESFDLDHHFLGDADEHLTHWFEDPKFSERPDLVAWLKARADRSAEQ